ncbi:MAG: hypothetical protein WBK28_04000 [Minisyncoccia bacterium]
MVTELTNLLPAERLRDFRRGYFLRLLVLTSILTTVLILSHGALLLPSYFYVSEEASIARARLAEMSSALSSAEEETMSARLTALAADTERLKSFSHSPRASSLVRTLLALPREGVTLSRMSYVPAKKDADGRLVLAGVAKNREFLQRFHQTLSAQPFVTKAELPLSAYAQETDIDFTITLSGPLSP